jgi:eukaryotic-like serine/threonine-protein kinase
MNPERQKRIDHIYRAALTKTAEARVSFLSEACAGDTELRREVEALFADSQTQAITVATGPLAPNSQIGAYRIDAQIGAGGMGIVFRAFDTKLKRPVAIKFLSDELADPVTRRRFQREAQMASSLNHPHIVAVYDAGEFETRHYLVTEFVDGGTFKDWVQAEKRTPLQVVELLTGVADGLAAAHEAGIVHRDVKPANILVAKNGYAKLADFGLAKLAEGPNADPTRTGIEAQTHTGVVIGTIAYMSPEQVSGKAPDSRSDIFSFGVVFYEALAGRRPFEGATGLELMQAILSRAPSPLPGSVPPALRVAIEKALEKNPADRYQSMRDLVIDLRRIARQTTESTTSIAPPRSYRWLWAAAFALVLGLSSAAILLRTRSAAPGPVQYEQITHFADSATSPALSPDGRMLTFKRSENADTFVNGGNIYVQPLPDGEPVQLTHDGTSKLSPVFLPDGARIAYGVSGGHHNWDTWVVPVLGGGEPTRMLANASGLTWIENAGKRRILFSEYKGDAGVHMAIVTSTESRSDAHDVYVPASVNGMAHRSYLSPDGKWVLVAEMEFSNWMPCRVVPYDGTSPGHAVGPSPARCTNAAWSPDGKWMYFSADTGRGFHIWRQRFPEGTPEQVTPSGATDEEGIAFAPDGRSFLTAIGSSQSTIWVHDAHGERQITSQGYGYQPSFSPDGKKLYFLVRSTETRHFVSGALWRMDLESGKKDPLVPDVLMQAYNVSADGKRVVFIGDDANGHSPLRLAFLDSRSGPRQLASVEARSPYFGANGDVFFVGDNSKGEFLYRVREDGSDLQPLAPSHFLYGVSPDGKWIAAWMEEPSETGNSIVAYPAAGGSPVLIVGNGAGAGAPYAPPMVSWSPDAKYFYVGVYAVPLPAGQILPRLPSSGLLYSKDANALAGARIIGSGGLFTGPNPSIYAYTKQNTQRNIYRVPVP